jgi:hypothetical protein
MDDDIESRIKSITDEFNKAAALILKNIKKWMFYYLLRK